jgi:hypothetical protein
VLFLILRIAHYRRDWHWSKKGGHILLGGPEGRGDKVCKGAGIRIGSECWYQL